MRVFLKPNERVKAILKRKERIMSELGTIHNELRNTKHPSKERLRKIRRRQRVLTGNINLLLIELEKEE